ncbi:DUF6636 domain-containing protein [Mycobacterium sp. MMS18-G62]
MAHHLERVLAAIAVMALAAGCGAGETVAQSSSPIPVSNQPRTTKARPDTMTGPSAADREVFELTGFVAPSGNVSCMIDAEWARCDIIDRDWSPPPRPADCEFDYGQGISLAPGEHAEFVCAGDTAFGADEVLPYGDSITAGVLRCESAESGITCRDTKTGHGFAISREAYRLF